MQPQEGAALKRPGSGSELRGADMPPVVGQELGPEEGDWEWPTAGSMGDVFVDRTRMGCWGPVWPVGLGMGEPVAFPWRSRWV